MRQKRFSIFVLMLAMVMMLTTLMPMTNLYAAGDDDDANTGENDKKGDADTVKDARKMVHW